MVLDNTPDDFGKLSDGTVLTDHGPLNTCTFFHLRGITDHRVRRYLGFLINEQTVLLIRGENPGSLREELRGSQEIVSIESGSGCDR